MIPSNSKLDDRIRQLFEDVLYIEVDSTQADLIENGPLDSLVLVELMVGSNTPSASGSMWWSWTSRTSERLTGSADWLRG